MASAAIPDFDARLEAFESAAFRELRPGQRQVLSAYAADHLNSPDLAIKMPTGEGKTLLVSRALNPLYKSSKGFETCSAVFGPDERLWFLRCQLQQRL